MKGYLKHSKIAGLIAADLAGVISDEGKMYLEAWIEESKDNRRAYERTVSRLRSGEPVKSYHTRSGVQADWHVMKDRLEGRKAYFRFRKIWVQYAAIITVMFGVGVAAFYIRESKKRDTVPVALRQDATKAGAQKAVLTLSDGRQVVLEDEGEGHIQTGDVFIEQKEGELNYQEANRAEDTCEVFNLINTPKGGEYKLMLADGTRVWVNAESQLKYPVRFVGTTRTVYMTGEAYFEVAPDAERPFIVRTPDDMSVKVLGTHFNVSAYEQDQSITTTLAEGKVEISDGEEAMVLTPNQQVLFDKKGRNFTRREVDAYRYLSWKDGKFIFEEETLENIMERLGRWYDIQVFFKSEDVKKLRFSGDLEKYSDFSVAVRMLEKVSNIKVSIDENVIHIEEK